MDFVKVSNFVIEDKGKMFWMSLKQAKALDKGKYWIGLAESLNNNNPIEEFCINKNIER